MLKEKETDTGAPVCPPPHKPGPGKLIVTVLQAGTGSKPEACPDPLIP